MLSIVPFVCADLRFMFGVIVQDDLHALFVNGNHADKGRTSNVRRPHDVDVDFRARVDRQVMSVVVVHVGESARVRNAQRNETRNTILSVLTIIPNRSQRQLSFERRSSSRIGVRRGPIPRHRLKAAATRNCQVDDVIRLSSGRGGELKLSCSHKFI